MLVGKRLRELREQRNFSQGDIEKRTGLLRCYNGHTVPSIETLEKWARALDAPLYQLFYEGENPPALPKTLRQTAVYVEEHREKDQCVMQLTSVTPYFARY